MTIDKLNFAVENVEFLEEELDNTQFARLKIDCFATGRSLHDTFVTDETLKKTSETILLKPVVFALDKYLNDASGHEENEVPAGFVPHNSPIEFVKLDDGRTMMRVYALIWKRYSGQLLKFFKRDGNKKKVSVEIEVFDSIYNEKSDLIELLDYCFNAITILGDFITSAIPNAQAVLQFSEEFAIAKKEFIETYSGGEIMPYTKVSDINPALKGIDPPITLSQANEIEKQAEAIGSNDKKNGWAIAISSFKKTHKVENGHWIKKENMSDESSKDNSSETNIKKDSFQYDNYLGTEENKDMDNDTNMKQDDEEIFAKDKSPEEGSPEEEKKETPAEEKKESPEKEKKEKQAGNEEKMAKENKIDMSLSEYLDVKAFLGFLENETKEYREMTDKPEDAIYSSLEMSMQEIAKGKNADIKVITSAMLSYMKEASSKMEEGKKIVLELEDLKKYKKNIEDEKMNFEVESALTEAFNIGMPENEIEELRAKASDFSLENIDTFKNMVKAKGFVYAANAKKEKEEIIRIGLPFNAPRQKSTKLWD